METRLSRILTIISMATILILPFGATDMKAFAADVAANNLIKLSENNVTGGTGPDASGGPGGPGGPGGMPGSPGGAGGPGGMTGGPGGPGGLDGANIGSEADSSEPVVSAAKSQLSDFDSIKNQDAVIAVYDLGLMDSCSGVDTARGFCPEKGLTLAEMAKAVAKATLLVRGDEPADHLAYCTEKGLHKGPSVPDKTITGYDAARMLLSALGVKGLSGDAGKDTVEEALKQYNLKDSLGDIDLSKVISRDNAAQMIVTALRLNKGKGLIPKVLHNSPVNVASGTMTIDNTRIFNFGGSAVQNSGDSILVVRNSRIDGDTSLATKPLSGPPGGLLVSGSIRTTLAIGKAKSFYINSEVISKNWAALSTDAATPVTEPGQTELAVYAYGSVSKTRDGGYGTYSDLFCNVYFYGLKMDSAEIGIISGTYGTVTVGTIGDGEANKTLAAQLSQADKDAQKNKNLGSFITGGRNAVMIHSVSLPPYWAYKGYSQEEIPLYSSKISIKGSAIATDLSLDKKVEYPADKQAYINHHSGSVILVKSCNADILLDKVTIKPDKKGTGALIHTAVNNDSSFMMKVPDGENYPGTNVKMNNMKVEGNILNEDYQRDMYLSLTGTSITGKIISGTVNSWNALCKEKGFEVYIIDPDGYKTVHGVNLILDKASVWKVTGESTLTSLTVEDGAVITAPEGYNVTMTVDGVKKTIVSGIYKGKIVLGLTK